MKRSIVVRQYLKQSYVRSGPTMSMCKCWNREVGRAKSPSGVPGYLRPLARLTRSSPRAAVLLHARSHESLGYEFDCRPCSEVAQSVERVEYSPTEGFGDIRLWSGGRRVALQSYVSAGNPDLLQLEASGPLNMFGEFCVCCLRFSQSLGEDRCVDCFHARQSFGDLVVLPWIVADICR